MNVKKLLKTIWETCMEGKEFHNRWCIMERTEEGEDDWLPIERGAKPENDIKIIRIAYAKADGEINKYWIEDMDGNIYITSGEGLFENRGMAEKEKSRMEEARKQKE